MMATQLNRLSLSDQALASFFEEIVKLAKATQDLVRSPGSSTRQKRSALRNLTLFTQILEHYERLIGRNKLISLDELPLKLYDSHLDRRDLGASYWTILDPYSIGNTIRAYYALDGDRRDSARLRSDELMAIKPQADAQSHIAIWESDLPVDLICSTVDIYDRFEVTVYEREAYQLGHDTKLWRRYGYWALMLLSPDQLRQAEDRFLDLEPRGDLKELSAIAKFRSVSMDADTLLELLRLGYSSVDQLRRAGELVGIGIRRRDYFDRLIAEGSPLASASHGNAPVAV